MILNKTPIRVGVPSQRVCHTREEAIDRINRHNGATDVYASLYNGDNIVDKIVFDFDVEPGDEDKYDDWDSMLSDFRRLSEHIEDEGWSQMSVLSGGGMHKYIKSAEYRLEYPRDALREAQQKFQEELDLKTDDAIFGDIERIFRVPNTWHPGAGRYCIPLEHEEIYLPREKLFELAEDQRFEIETITQGESYPVHQHDSAGSSYTSHETGERIEADFNPAEVAPEGAIFEIYPCISNLLQNWDTMEQRGHGLGFRRRFLVILHLKETGHTYKETVQILKKYLSSEEFHHCVRDEKQPRQVYRRDDMIFPECDRLMTEIGCIHDPPEDPCEDKDSLYI